MLASGAHVKIGSIELKLLENNELGIQHYRHVFEPEYARNEEGTPRVENIRSELIFWIRDDWSGGEGDKFYDGEFPNTYTESNAASVRTPGSIRPRPTVTLSSAMTLN